MLIEERRTINQSACYPCSGGIFLAPFTAGLSLGLTIGGVAASVAGTATNITTSIVDNRLTKKYIGQLESCLRKIEKKMGDAREAMKNYLATLEWFKKAHGIDINMASILIQKWTANIAEIATGVTRAAKLIEISNKFYDAVKTMKTIGELTVKGTTSAAFTFTKPIAELTKAELEATKIFVNSGGAGWALNATSKVFNGVFVVIGVGASIWEIYNLVKDWDTNPTAEAVDKSVAKLQEIKKDVNKNLEAL